MKLFDKRNGILLNTDEHISYVFLLSYIRNNLEVFVDGTAVQHHFARDGAAIQALADEIQQRRFTSTTRSGKNYVNVKQVCDQIDIKNKLMITFKPACTCD